MCKAGKSRPPNTYRLEPRATRQMLDSFRRVTRPDVDPSAECPRAGETRVQRQGMLYLLQGETQVTQNIGDCPRGVSECNRILPPNAHSSLHKSLHLCPFGVGDHT